jgi:hypothetical protein
MWKLLELWEASGRTQDELFDRVIGGMNFTPARPAYEDMRDGILASTTSTAEACVVWNAFAQFGIGEGADGVETCRGFFCRISVTQSFVVPSSCSGGGDPNTAPVVSISSPTPNASFVGGTSITFTGSANDTQDGNISSSLAWTSSRDGAIGNGASFTSSTLSVGSHTITAGVTDDGGLTGSAAVTITVTDPGGGGEPTIALDAVGRKVKGVQHADLSWSGATSTSIDIFRNGVSIVTTTNDGAHTDNIGAKGGGSYIYKVCEAGTTVCSPEKTVVF